MVNNLDKYIEDPKFINWVFRPSKETEDYFAGYHEEYPGEKKEMLKLRKELRLLTFPEEIVTDEKKDQLFRITLAQMLRKKKQKREIKFPLSVFKYAAILVMVSVGSWMFVHHKMQSIDLKLTEDLFLKNASQNPTLFLGDGSKHAISGNNAELDFSMPGQIEANGESISSAQSGGSKPDVLVVPFGKKARVKLSDGTRICVNAGSRIIFPDRFTQKKREIYLVGEAYFEVAHDPDKPFLVKTSTVTIRVLGTSFNVSSYPDDEFVSTVLKEGKIRMEENDSQLFESSVDLIPNQMAVFKKDGNGIRVVKTDPENYILWTDGILKFEKQEINQLITKVERFYNISIELKNPQIGKERITGKLDLNAGILEVFESISQLSHAKIKKISAVEYILE